MGAAVRSRAAMEELWRERVQEARQKYDAVRAECRKICEEQQQGLTISPDGDLAVRRALQDETIALQEYTHLIRVFTELIVNGTIPEA